MLIKWNLYRSMTIKNLYDLYNTVAEVNTKEIKIGKVEEKFEPSKHIISTLEEIQGTNRYSADFSVNLIEGELKYGTFDKGYKKGLEDYKDYENEFITAFQTSKAIQVYRSITGTDNKGNIYLHKKNLEDISLYGEELTWLINAVVDKGFNSKGMIGYLIGFCESYIQKYSNDDLSYLNLKIRKTDFTNILKHIFVAKHPECDMLYDIVINIIPKEETTLLYNAFYAIGCTKDAFNQISDESLKYNDYALLKKIIKVKRSAIMRMTNNKEYLSIAYEYISNDPSLIESETDMVNYQFKIKGEKKTKKEIIALIKIYSNWNNFKTKFLLNESN